MNWVKVMLFVQLNLHPEKLAKLPQVLHPRAFCGQTAETLIVPVKRVSIQANFDNTIFIRTLQHVPWGVCCAPVALDIENLLRKCNHHKIGEAQPMESSGQYSPFFCDASVHPQ